MVLKDNAKGKCPKMNNVPYNCVRIYASTYILFSTVLRMGWGLLSVLKLFTGFAIAAFTD
jgi:hypothetical protein